MIGDKPNPTLNAIVTMDAERVYERAHEADKALARAELWGPLHGVPFTLKDAHATAGIRTTTGFPPLAGYVPQEDSTLVSRRREASASCPVLGQWHALRCLLWGAGHTPEPEW